MAHRPVVPELNIEIGGKCGETQPYYFTGSFSTGSDTDIRM